MSTEIVSAAMRFEDPWVLWAILVIAAGLAWRAWRDRRGSPAVLFSSVALLPRGSASSWRFRLRWVLLGLRLVAALLLVLALARPQIALAQAEIAAEGIDIVLALDVSSSMTSRDFAGARRIDAVKRVAREFVGGLKNDRVGVVLFAAETLKLSPPTLDHRALQGLIDGIEAGKVLRDGTAIGVGLATALDTLRDSPAKSKVAILLTDGENNTGVVEPMDAAEIGRLLGVRVYTIGAVGTTGSVDEFVLTQMAKRAGGVYQRASDEGTLLAIYRDIADLEKSRVGGRRFTSYLDIYLLFLVPGAALLLLELLLAATTFRRLP